MRTLPLFWDSKFAAFQNCNLAEITISNGRKFLVSFQTNESYFLIPGRLTFGGFFPADNSPVTEKEFLELLNILGTDYIEGLDVRWKLPPQYFFSEIFHFQNELSNYTDVSEIIEINQHINIPIWNIRKMSKGNQKKIKQATSTGMIFKKAELDEVPKCYTILAQNRSAIGVQVTMELAEILKAITDFPSIYGVRYLELDEEVVAMCLTVDIAPEVRYVLYWADNMNFRKYSPVALLCKKLIEISIIENIEILDLGISSDNGTLNEGLHRFKENLGADSSRKKTILSNKSFI